jgi:hypothetical protein
MVLVPCASAWTWPVHGPVLETFSFDPSHPYAAGQHRGIAVAADDGVPVLAPVAGVVTFAGTVPVNGKTLTLETSDGLAVSLTHLGSLEVERGAAIAEGARVGTAGASGTPEFGRPYVHLGVRQVSNDQGYLDPLQFLPAPPAPAAPAAAPAPAAASAPAAAPATPSPPTAAPAAAASAAAPAPATPPAAAAPAPQAGAPAAEPAPPVAEQGPASVAEPAAPVAAAASSGSPATGGITVVARASGTRGAVREVQRRSRVGVEATVSPPGSNRHSPVLRRSAAAGVPGRAVAGGPAGVRSARPVAAHVRPARRPRPAAPPTSPPPAVTAPRSVAAANHGAAAAGPPAPLGRLVAALAASGLTLLSLAGVGLVEVRRRCPRWRERLAT